jgi:hypothetical protein
MLYRALIDQPDFGKRVFKYLEAFNNLESPDEAEKALGVSVADLDFQMRNYVNDSGKKRVMLDLKDVTDLKLPAGTPVSRLDSLLGIATICLDAGCISTWSMNCSRRPMASRRQASRHAAAHAAGSSPQGRYEARRAVRNPEQGK